MVEATLGLQLALVAVGAWAVDMAGRKIRVKEAMAGGKVWEVQARAGVEAGKTVR